MTKTSRIMLAVLALCGTSAAMAQSSVNLYGRVNTTIEQWKLGSADSTTGLRTNSSFIGFRGQEDLGAGVKVGFQLEGNFGSDDGAGANGSGLDFKRHSELNLSGNFGTLRLGKFNAGSYLATADYISMHNHDTGLSADALYAYVFPEGNQVAYRTPDFGGLTAEIQYGFGEDAVTAGTDHQGRVVDVLHDDAIDLAVNYANGPLGLGFGYTQAKRIQTFIGEAKEQQFAVRGSYALGALTLGAYYQHHKDDRGSAADAKRNTYRLSAMYAVGASEFHANVGRADKAKVGGSKVNGSAATQWTLGYNHNLSKRTKAYAYYSKVNNGLNSSFATGTDNADLRAIAVGVRHLF